MLKSELGNSWEKKLIKFDEKPVAAASIGQVHRAINKDGKKIAMKIQYPGIAKSIDSDLNNIRKLMNYTNFLPKRLFLDQIIIHTRNELYEECDYEIEAEKQKKFRFFNYFILEILFLN